MNSKCLEDFKRLSEAFSENRSRKSKILRKIWRRVLSTPPHAQSVRATSDSIWYERKEEYSFEFVNQALISESMSINDTEFEQN